MTERNRSTYLFATPSFAEGVARILDFGNTLQVYNVSPTGEDADYRALRADWYAVGDDLRDAIAVERDQRHRDEGRRDG